MRILLVFSSSGLGGAERSLTRMALASPPGVYQLATLDGEGPWCDWVRSQGQQPLVFGVRNGALHGSLRMGAFVSLLRHVRREDIQIVYICGLRASLWLRLLNPLMPGVKLVHGIRWNPDSNLRLDRFFRVVERRLNGLVDLYITNSQIAATTLVKRCGVSLAAEWSQRRLTNSSHTVWELFEQRDGGSNLELIRLQSNYGFNLKDSHNEQQ